MKDNKQQVYFRVDHGSCIGDGHLFRDKALASKMLEFGWHPVFVTREREGFNADKFLPFELRKLKKTSALANSSDYKSWLGTSENEDAQECLSVCHPGVGAVWVVDHYAISKEWEKRMVENGQIVIAIDDLFREHHAHLILDHNLSADLGTYKNHLKDATTLIGTQFALLRDEITQAEKYKFQSQDSVLLFLGAAEEKIFYKFLVSLRELSLAKLVIIAPPSGFVPQANEEILNFCADLPALYLQQKLVIGSCGVAHLERLALGVPSITGVIVDNQLDVGIKTQVMDVNWHLGDIRQMKQDELNRNINSAFENITTIQERAIKGQLAVALDGTVKVINEIEQVKRKFLSR